MEFNNQNPVQGTTMNLNNMSGAQPPVFSSQPMQTVVQPQPNMNVNVGSGYGAPTQVNEQVNSQAYQQVVQQTRTNFIPQPVQPIQPVQPQQIPTPQPVQPVQPVQPQVEQTAQAVEPVKEQQPQSIKQAVEKINTDKYIIRLSELKDMVKNACNLAVSVDGITLTTLIQLMFTKDGLIMKATDNDNILVEKNSNITYNQEISIAVRSELFQKLVNKLNTEYIELVPDTQSRIVTIIADEDKFQLTEVYDQEDGQSINIDNPFYTEGVNGIPFDGNALNDRLSTVKSFTSTTNVYAVLTGVYLSDKIYATNRDDMICVPNLPELTGETMYLTDKFVKAFTAMTFTGETKMYVQKDEDGIATSVTIYDDNKILSGPVNPDIDKFPIEPLRKLLSKDLSNIFSIDGNKLYSKLDIATLFVNSIQDKDTLGVTTLPQETALNIKTRNGASNTVLKLNVIDPNKSELKPQQFGLFLTGMLNILKNIDRTDVKMSIGNSDVAGETVVIIYSGDYIALSSMKSLD